jgi:hypothetical protein
MSRIIYPILMTICFWSYVFAQKVPFTFQNPIIPGFQPNPKICRVNNDYYFVNSSFAYDSGIPTFCSNIMAYLIFDCFDFLLHLDRKITFRVI